jgi:hypothetical protein
MIAYIILILAALTRLIPHALHGTGMNFTAVGAGLLFFGSRRPRWQALAALAILAATDFYLTRFVYGFPFQIKGYIATWAWYAAVCLLASGLLRKVTALRVATGVLASATSFFLLSNFVVWVGSGMYPHNGSGLVACYVAALPFYANDLISTAVLSAALFGLPAVAAKLTEAVHAHGNQPLM